CVIFLSVCLFLRKNDSDDAATVFLKLFLKFALILGLLLRLLFVILLPLHLDGTLPWPLWAVFIPLFLQEAIGLCKCQIPIQLLQKIFILLRCEGIITWNWYLVFIPMYVGLGLSIFCASILNIFAWAGLRKFKAPVTLRGIRLLLHIVTLFEICLLVFFILLGQYLNSPEAMQIIMVFIPIYVLFAIAFAFVAVCRMLPQATFEE